MAGVGVGAGGGGEEARGGRLERAWGEWGGGG